MGHPENSRLAGAPSGYIVRQLADFASGARKGAANMVTFSRALTADEMKTAADYFAALPLKRWTRVIEADTVPKTYFLGTRRMPLPAGGTEPISSRESRRAELTALGPDSDIRFGAPLQNKRVTTFLLPFAASPAMLS
jgi:hypothetical protein